MYSYIGPADLKLKALQQDTTARQLIGSENDVLTWMRSEQMSKTDVAFIATFVVDASGLLWIADRHSEHVACARGGDVLAAGEIAFFTDAGQVSVFFATNQSTGYCPEPESWPSVVAALDRAGIAHPGGFTQAFLFRRCDNCGQTNIVKEDDFTCAVCGAALNPKWNYTHDATAKQERR